LIEKLLRLWNFERSKEHFFLTFGRDCSAKSSSFIIVSCGSWTSRIIFDTIIIVNSIIIIITNNICQHC
ncbi:hypothetical protein T4B_10272, partial [Trichinella pseudospiralis]